MLWAYLSFSQFLIIWSGNLPEEIPWYIAAHPRRLGRRSRCCSWSATSHCPSRCSSRAISSGTAACSRKVAIFVDRDAVSSI